MARAARKGVLADGGDKRSGHGGKVNPQKVDRFAGNPVRLVACGFEHAAAITGGPRIEDMEGK